MNKGGQGDKWSMSKGLGTDLGGGHEARWGGFPVDQCTSAQVQSFNEDAGGGGEGVVLELDTLSLCEVSLNTVALFDPGLVSSSSRMLSQTAPSLHYL